MYKNVHFRIALFGHETTWLYVCIVGEILILLLLGFLSVNSYTLYTLEGEDQQKAAEEEWMDQLETKVAKRQMECVMKILFAYSPEMRFGMIPA